MELRNCDVCGKSYIPDPRNLKRGWGLCCSKSCAAKKREMSKPGYDPDRVVRNNERRRTWNGPRDENEYGVYTGHRTSEGYKKYMNGDEYTAIDEFGNPMYTLEVWDEDPDDSMYWNGKDY